jgi:hypothetical protein
MKQPAPKFSDVNIQSYKDSIARLDSQISFQMKKIAAYEKTIDSLNSLPAKIKIKYRDQKDVLNETHKMRMTIAYGLERFWGEPLRLEKESQPKANYWKDVWKTLLEEFLQPSGLGTKLPSTYSSYTEKIQYTIQLIWDMDQEEREISQMILTQFCDSLVWWSQRLKIKKSK